MKLSIPIDLEFNKQNFIKLLKLGAEGNQVIYSHKQISDWCDKFWAKYYLDDLDIPEEIECILSVLADVETQWDLYLVNTYRLEQLQNIDYESVKLPCNWFRNWLGEIDT